MTSDSTDRPNVDQLAAEIDRLHQRIDRLQFWGDTTTRHLEKLAETLAEQENK